MFKKIMRKIPRILFYVSLLYWVFSIGSCIASYWTGCEIGFFPGKIVYGKEAVEICFEWLLPVSLYIFWPIPLYQIVYLIVTIVRKTQRRIKNHESAK